MAGTWIENAVDTAFNKLSNFEDYIAKDVLQGWTPAQIPDLTGKVYLVTGGNSGIGFQTCRKLCENGAHVYMVSRDITRGQEAAMQIRQQVGKQARIDVLECDLTSLRNVVSLVREFKRNSSKLDCLINNAGVFFPGPFGLTGDKLEQTLQINYYSHLLLTLLLLDTLRATPGSRVVFMSSLGEQFGKLDWSNLTGEKYRDSGLTPYGTSKMFMLMVTRELAVRVPEVDFFCAHPGEVDTPFVNKVSFRYPMAIYLSVVVRMFGLTPYRAAVSPLYTATEPTLTGKHWTYIGPNNAMLWPTTERLPASKPVFNPASCWRLLEDSTRILRDRLGGAEQLSLPPHPEEGNTLAPAVHGLTPAVGKWL